MLFCISLACCKSCSGLWPGHRVVSLSVATACYHIEHSCLRKWFPLDIYTQSQSYMQDWLLPHPDPLSSPDCRFISPVSVGHDYTLPCWKVPFWDLNKVQRLHSYRKHRYQEQIPLASEVSFGNARGLFVAWLVGILVKQTFLCAPFVI